jgi:hypothetical protein
MRAAFSRFPSVSWGSSHATGFLTWIETHVKRFRDSVFSTYHPERHYMRGAGPKWREKHEAAEAPASQANAN